MQAGDTTKYEYYITKGCLKVYTLDEDGAPHISMFAVEDYWTGDMASFMTREPSRYFIKATEDSELLGISRTNYDLLFQEIPKFERFYRILYQKSLISYIRRSNHGISLSAEERYIEFKRKYPNIVNRITQKDLAPGRYATGSERPASAPRRLRLLLSRAPPVAGKTLPSNR